MSRRNRRNPKPATHSADSSKNTDYTVPAASAVNATSAARPTYAVDVVWPGNYHRGTLQYAPTLGSRFGSPVLVMDGKEHGAYELPKDCKVVVTWREVRAGPVWDLIHRAMTTGHLPIEILESERDEDMFRLMKEITLLRSQVAHRDSRILVLEQRLRDAQLILEKSPWWAFWRRRPPLPADGRRTSLSSPH